MGRLGDARAVLNGERTARPVARRKEVPLTRRAREGAAVLLGNAKAVKWTNTDARLGVYREGPDPDQGLTYSQGGARFFRKLTQSANDLPEYEFATMLRVSNHLFRSSPVARRVIEVRSNYVLGDGVRVTAQDADVQAVIDAFLADPFNQFDRRVHGLVNAWRTYGELILPVTVNRVDGKVRVGFISPDRVAEVIPSPTNVADVVAIRLKDSVDADGRPVDGPVLKVIRLVEDPNDADFGHYRGDVFYIPANRLPDQTRGLSDLWTIADFVTAHEETIWSLAEGAAIRNAFVLHVVYKGLDEDELAERFDTTNALPPTPGEMVVTNDQVEYRFLTPTFGASDAAAWGDIILAVIATGADLPPWVLGKQDDPNKASAGVFTGPMLRAMKELQRELRAWVEDLIDFVVDQATRVPGLIPADADLSFEVITPDLDNRDVTASAAALQQGGTAIVGLRDAELLDRTTAIDGVAVLIERLGVTVDGVTIRERLEEDAEAAAKKANDDDLGLTGPSDPFAGLIRPPVPTAGDLTPPGDGDVQTNDDQVDDPLGRPAGVAAGEGTDAQAPAAPVNAGDLGRPGGDPGPDDDLSDDDRRRLVRLGRLARAGTQAAKCPNCGAKGAPNLICRKCGNAIPATAEVWVPDDATEADDRDWSPMPGAAALVPGREGRFQAPTAAEREALIDAVLDQVVDALSAGVGSAAEAGSTAWPDRKARRRQGSGA